MQIDKHVPVPKARTVTPYPFAEMQVGDSFALPQPSANNLRMAAARYRKETPDWKYTTRLMPDDTIRLWRTE